MSNSPPPLHTKTPHGGKICHECGTRETPLWRCGPDGGRSLCNACGIRWKRAAQSSSRKAKSKTATAKHGHHISKTGVRGVRKFMILLYVTNEVYEEEIQSVPAGDSVECHALNMTVSDCAAPIVV
jgi:hypothetical protein